MPLIGRRAWFAQIARNLRRFGLFRVVCGAALQSRRSPVRSRLAPWGEGPASSHIWTGCGPRCPVPKPRPNARMRSLPRWWCSVSHAFDSICYLGYSTWVWDVEFTDQFGAWWETLGAEEQQSIDAAVRVLEQRGPGLGRPLVDSVVGSRHANMKELRAAPSGSCSRSIRGGPRFFCWVETSATAGWSSTRR
jgi:hypothetical protein